MYVFQFGAKRSTLVISQETSGVSRKTELRELKRESVRPASAQGTAAQKDVVASEHSTETHYFRNSVHSDKGKQLAE